LVGLLALGDVDQDLVCDALDRLGASAIARQSRSTALNFD
jgi:hypothetical protein